jgi:hypothetical protein
MTKRIITTVTFLTLKTAIRKFKMHPETGSWLAAVSSEVAQHLNNVRIGFPVSGIEEDNGIISVMYENILSC